MFNLKKIYELIAGTSLNDAHEIPVSEGTGPGLTKRYSIAQLKAFLWAYVQTQISGITKGDTGAQGATGAQGMPGEKGLKGDKGDKGDTGVKGDVGPSGSQGVQGPKGDKGDQGDTGPQGTQGVKGDKGDQGVQGERGLPSESRNRFTVLPNVDGNGETIGNSGLSYNTLTNEYIIGLYAYARYSKIQFFHRDSANLLNYNPIGTLTPVPDREIDISAYLYHLQGVAFDDSNNSYWCLGCITAVSSNAQRVLVNVDDTGNLLSSTPLWPMLDFQAGSLVLDNERGEFIIKPNDKYEIYFLDKTTKTLLRTYPTLGMLYEGLAYDKITNTIWLGDDTGFINVYRHDDMKLIGSSSFISLKDGAASANVGMNVEGMLIDPIDGKLLISFDGYLHGGWNNGNCLWKYEIGNTFYSQTVGGYNAEITDLNDGQVEGHYFFLSTSTNTPITGDGYLYVTRGRAVSNPYIVQRLIYRASLREFTRQLSAGVWSSWSETPKLSSSATAVGDLLVNVATNQIGKVADVAIGNALLSGGVNAPPTYGKIGLTTHVSGILPAPNGGTGQNTYAIGDLLYASALNTLSKRTVGVNGQVLTVVAGVPSWATPATATLASGNYSPTISSTDNVTTIGTSSFIYTRIGDIVTVTGVVMITPTAANTSTAFSFSLPIASNFTSQNDGFGSSVGANFTYATNGYVYADHTVDLARCVYSTGSSASAVDIRFSFTYIIKP